MSKKVTVTFFQDGNVDSIDTMTRKDFLEKLHEFNWGENVEFGDENTDLKYFSGLILTDGDILKPRIKEIRTKWSFD